MELFSPSDVKAIKPDPEIYQILIHKFQIIPGESVFIDDRIENVEGAQEMGIRSILFTSPKQAKTELSYLLKTYKDNSKIVLQLLFCD